MIKRYFTVCLAAAGLTAFSCHSNLFLGKVEGIGGKALALNGRTPFFHAKVSVYDLKPTGFYAETDTDDSGEFHVSGVPDGKYRVVISSPNNLFSESYFIEVVDGYSPGHVEALIDPAREGTFLVIPGKYDDPGEVLGELGYLYQTTDAASLANFPSVVDGADILCIGSGADNSYAANAFVRSSLRSFVSAGGILVVTDKAWPYIAGAWPGVIGWGENPEIGESQEVTANIADADLRAYFTRESWKLSYDLPGWALPAEVQGDVLVSGNVTTRNGLREDAPLLCGFSYGDGFVIYSTFGWRRQIATGRLILRAALYVLANR